MDDKTTYKCSVCEKIFSKKSNFQNHYNNIHQETKLQEIFICHHCEKQFKSKFNLIRHFSTCRKYSEGRFQVSKRVKCALCNYENSRQTLLQHYNEQHGVNISTECMDFSNFHEFEKWKNETEKSNTSKYIRYASKKSESKTHYYYRCHRDGFFKSSGKNIRHLKIMGSNKINGFCPSRMDVTINNTGGEVSAKFVKTHVGHQMDLGKIPLTKLEKNKLATKISQKIPFDDIINEIRDTVTEEKMERMHLLTRKDLFNIEKLYNLNNSVRHSSDYVSVEAWISEIQENVCDSVIRFYKGQGQLNSPYCELRTEDFLLIIMNDAQLETLKKYGSDCICIDSTHGLNAYNFELTTLMVLDELRQGFPCLFAFSNRSDNVVFKIVFTVLRQALGVSATPRVFMSDMAENFYIAWSDVMGPVEFRLFCSWHVLRAWKKNVNSKIKKTEKQLSVHATLRILLEELDETAFEKMLENFINSTTNDHELTDFGQYFLKNYYNNRKFNVRC
jgi:hypothetical protein